MEETLPLSTSMQTPLIAVIGIVSLFYLATKVCKRPYARLPPGPPSKLSIGTAIPAQHPWRYFAALSKQYNSPVVTVWQGTQPIVICNSVRSAEELLEKNARVTADRPRSIIGDEVLSGNKRILLVGYGERWKKLRKAFHAVLQPSAAKEYEPLQDMGARRLISDISQSPRCFQTHIRSFAATLAVKMAFGSTDLISCGHDDYKAIGEEGRRLGIALRPGAFKIEAFPFLRYWPGYLRVPRQWHREDLAFFTKKLQESRKKMATNDLGPCFATYITQKQAELQLDDNECAYLCGTVLGAGSDTSSSAVTVVVMAAATFPEQARRVQDELDSVFGSDRLPSLDFYDDLPVTVAFVKETFRWRPVTVGGFQHRSTETLVYGDYVIPAGTTILGNHYGIHRDEEVFPDPDRFDIDRWLCRNPQNGFYELKSDIRHYQYGFGRRACPAQFVADRTVFLAAAMLLWSFDIKTARDEQGKEIEIDTLAFTSTANTHPLPFRVAFENRKADLGQILGEVMP